ncbi:MAG: hypothetical protein IRY99_24410 [Isosphaeraceae bacterium]|nr:hypothetical protein [Isosphaeraceae bacterium]
MISMLRLSAGWLPTGIFLAFALADGASAQILTAPDPDVGRRDTVRLTTDAVARLGIRVEPAQANAHPSTLALTGTLDLDPNHLARLRPRFPGEVVEVTTTVDAEGEPRTRCPRLQRAMIYKI